MYSYQQCLLFQGIEIVPNCTFRDTQGNGQLWDAQTWLLAEYI